MEKKVPLWQEKGARTLQVGPGAWPVVLRTLRVVGAFPVPRGAAPRCPAYPAGVPISPEKWGERGPGASPLDPRFLWPLVPTRWFWGSLPLVRSWDYFLRYAKTDLGRIFEGKYAEKAFCERKSPNQGTDMGAIIAQRPLRPKPSPRGEGGPAKPGRMRGRPIGLTEREKEGVGATGPSFYKERLGTGSPPHQSPSVTASPQGEASGLCSPTRKSIPRVLPKPPPVGRVRPTASQTSAGRSRRNPVQSVFCTDMCRAKNTSQPASVPARARAAAANS